MKRISFFLFLMMPLQLWALIPLEGLILGDVRDVQQYDPLSGIFRDQSIYDKANMSSAQREKLEMYKGFFRDGAQLAMSCDLERYYTYENVWNEAGAKRAIVSTLQYIGLDISLRAIVKYSKSLEMTDEEFKNIVDNLIENNCSPNLSVYSLKLLRDNFMEVYSKGSDFVIPSIENSPYFTPTTIEKVNSHKAKMREFNFSLKNFRAFCSWNGDTDDYRLLVPYLQNPYIMAYIHNHLLRRKIEWNNELKVLNYTADENSVQVACEDLICRKKNVAGFIKQFPRMVGSTELEDDLKVLYCSHFRNISFKTSDQNEKVKEWIKHQTLEEPRLEAMNFVSQLTGIPEFVFSVDKYEDIQDLFKNAIDHRWSEWANGKSSQLLVDLLYEESLYIDLVPMSKSLEISKGDFQLIFDYTLGEMDRVLNVVDKISSNFSLVFPKSYLKWLKENYVRASNKSQFAKMTELENTFTAYINVQLEQKEKLFMIPMWNEKMGHIMAMELINQLLSYRGGYFTDFSHEKVKIPVEFRYGLFALQYFRKRFKTIYRSKTLTYK